MRRLADSFGQLSHVLLFVLGIALVVIAAAASLPPAVATAMVVAGAGLSALGALAPRLEGDVELGAQGFKGRLVTLAVDAGASEEKALELADLVEDVDELRKEIRASKPFKANPTQRAAILNFIRRHPNVLQEGPPTGGAAIAQPATRPGSTSGGAAIKSSRD